MLFKNKYIFLLTILLSLFSITNSHNITYDFISNNNSGEIYYDYMFINSQHDDNIKSTNTNTNTNNDENYSTLSYYNCYKNTDNFSGSIYDFNKV